MKWEADLSDPKPMHFMIREDHAAGFYLYVYEGGQGLYDYLQETLDATKNFALRKFQVPLTAWRRVE